VTGLEFADAVRRTRGGCSLVATRDAVIGGEKITAYETRISPSHPWASRTDVFTDLDRFRPGGDLSGSSRRGNGVPLWFAETRGVV
jgi:hypothetical protein